MRNTISVRRQTIHICLPAWCLRLFFLFWSLSAVCHYSNSVNVILGAWCLRAVLVDEDNDGEIDFQEFVIAMTGAQVSELSYARLA